MNALNATKIMKVAEGAMGFASVASLAAGVGLGTYLCSTAAKQEGGLTLALGSTFFLGLPSAIVFLMAKDAIHYARTVFEKFTSPQERVQFRDGRGIEQILPEAGSLYYTKKSPDGLERFLLTPNYASIN